MVKLPIKFEPASVVPSTGAAGQLPVSDDKGHLVIITESDMKNTLDNTGTYLNLILRIVEGPHAGQEASHKLNIGNKSAEAVRIAYAELSAICHVTGSMQDFEDSSYLHNKPFRVIVKAAAKAEDAAKGYTNVSAIRDVNGNKPTLGGGNGSGPAPAPAPQPASGGFPPVMAQQPQPQPAPQQWPAQMPPLASQQPQPPQQYAVQPAGYAQQPQPVPQQYAQQPYTQPAQQPQQPGQVPWGAKQ